MSKVIGVVKKYYKLIIGILIIIFGIISISLNRGTYSNDTANETDSLSIVCSEEIKFNESFSCNVYLNSSLMEVKGISFNYDNANSVEVKNFIPSSGWNLVNDELDNGVVLVNLDNSSNYIELGSMELSISDDNNSEYKIGLNNITIGDGDEIVSNLGDVSIQVLINDDEIEYELNFDESLIVDSDNKYIKYLIVGTKVSNIISMVRVQDGDVTIYDKNNNIKSDDDKLATGDILKIQFQGELKEEYKLSLIGDATGDGFFDPNDLYKLRQHLVNNNILTGVYNIALDFNQDEVSDINDLFAFRQALVNDYFAAIEKYKK